MKTASYILFCLGVICCGSQLILLYWGESYLKVNVPAGEFTAVQVNTLNHIQHPLFFQTLLGLIIGSGVSLTIAILIQFWFWRYKK